MTCGRLLVTSASIMQLMTRTIVFTVMHMEKETAAKSQKVISRVRINSQAIEGSSYKELS